MSSINFLNFPSVFFFKEIMALGSLRFFFIFLVNIHFEFSDVIALCVEQKNGGVPCVNFWHRKGQVIMRFYNNVD